MIRNKYLETNYHGLIVSKGDDGWKREIHNVKGITMIFLMGNDRLSCQTISNNLTWVITMVASIIDNSFSTVITVINI